MIKTWEIHGRFRMGKGCVDQILNLEVSTEKIFAEKRKVPVHDVFTEIKNTYDRTD